MPGIERHEPLYQQVATAIRAAITSGEFPPDAPLPSEAQLIERYKVSRPTVRNAIAALRSEGLIDVIHGKGSFVKGASTPPLTIERNITRTGKTFAADHTVWEQVHEPTVYRTTTTAATGPLLELGEEEALFGVDRVLISLATGTRALHRVLIPFATAEIAPSLAEAPDAAPEAIYAALTAAGHKLTWFETVRARMPQADERSALELPDATPVVHILRVTHGTDYRPLLLEELRSSGAQVQLSYRITADSPRTLRAVRS
ncbi:GntR family transcriptional regulator [Streptomyces sp. H10-C2]|uniref:GntR family transcriptional regulator n=1 Tax=unclassified Streptomyces TaxID=2593676 RepID=UPI0024B88E00|nr:MULTISPECIES: GntR family transcriptional regulator [unclassified Streptomyces]MDJ0341392.1 GntR family transcriptional regulator [Streptomyces sp. PH10-H1]MDJ0370987.1 GntR family transcriptional regulator [Streptomyces sp. H10-C2]